MSSAELAELWEAIAELRDELHDLANRVDHVHREALRALTHVMEGRKDAEATPGNRDA